MSRWTFSDDVPDSFWDPFHAMCDRLEAPPRSMLRVMYSESGVRSTALNDNPKTRQENGVTVAVPPEERWNAAGITQMMPSILKAWFMPKAGRRERAEAFRSLSAIDQLPYVEKYFAPHRSKLVNDAACYMANFMPAYLSKAIEPLYVLAGRFGPHRDIYMANPVFDHPDPSKRKVYIVVDDMRAHLERVCVGSRYDELERRMVAAPDTIPPGGLFGQLATTAGIQDALTRLGYCPGPVDGEPGARTAAAVVAFQTDHGLERDGIVGPVTLDAMKEALLHA